jgi:hypothetical protein
MQGQRSELIDFKARWAERNRRIARPLLLETMHVRHTIPELPRLGRAAVALVAGGGGLTLGIDPQLDDVDLKLACYALAMRSARFDRADAIQRSTIRAARRSFDRAANPPEVLERLVGS